jgi:putative tryptophan/tyrosine transport system substrate-binding protein
VEDSVKRRQFITLLGSLAISCPVGAYAQQKQPRRVGVLSQDLQPGLLETFRSELHTLGYVEGKNISIELRNAAGRNERLPILVEELLKLKVDVIVAVNTPAVQAAKKATKTVPIVMMRVADPVKSGLVASLARPGGNVTGLSFMPDALGPKGVELLHEILPKMTRIAALYQGNNPGAVIIIDEVERKGKQLGLTLVRVPVHDEEERDFARAFEVAAGAQAEALFVMDDGAMTKRRQQILELAAEHALPVVSIYRDFATSGGLIAYGPNLNAVYRRAADYVDKLMKGEAAAALPVEQPVSFDLAINLKTAKALGIAIPQSVLVRVDELIE